MKIILAASAFAAISFFASPALAVTCSDRQQICFDYCDHMYFGSPRCLGTCVHLLRQCKATGCWDSRITGRRCGIIRR
jgi:hypothetical protein